MMNPHEPIQLIETMRVEAGRTLPLLAGHLQRLADSCNTLGYVQPGVALDTAIEQRLALLDADQAYRMRLLVAPDGTFTLTADPLLATPEPVQLLLHPDPLQADPFWLRHKTTRRPWYDAAQQWLAQHDDYFDLVFCNDQDLVCEASRSNVYIQDAAGQWLTPPASCGLLAGVQRQILLDQGLVRVALISRQDFIDAPAWRVSNALRGWLNAVLSPATPFSDYDRS